MDQIPAKKKPGGHTRRWFVRLFITLVAAVALVGLLPSLVSWTGMVGPLASRFLPNAELEIESASIGWFSTIQMTGVRYATNSQDVSVAADEISTERTLLDFLHSWKNVGRVRVVGLVVVASSVESAAKPEPPKPDNSHGLGSALDGIEMSIQVVDGAFTVQSTEIDADSSQLGPRSQTLRNVQALLAIPGQNATDLHCELTGELADSANASQVELSADVQLDDETGGLAMVDAKLKSKDLPLELANSIFSFMDSDVRISGLLTCDAKVELAMSSGEGTVKGEATVQNLSCQGGWISPDHLQLARLDGRADLRFSRERLEIDDGSIECDLGVAHGRGRLDWNAADGAVPSLDVRATIDLPKLCKQLPQTIGLRPDVDVTGGQLFMSIQPAADSAERLDASLEIRELAAVCQGETVAWNSPLSATGRIGVRPQDAVVFDSFQCESDFLRAKGSGSLSNFDVTAVCDLGKIQERTGRLLDLNALTFAGKATARIQSQRAEDGTVRLRGAARGESLDIRQDGAPLIAEPQIDAQLVAIVRLAEATSIESCLISMQAKEEQATLELSSRVADWRKSWGDWKVQGAGELARMARRAEPWTGPVDSWSFSGATSFAGQITFDSDSTNIRSVRATIRDLKATSDGVRIVDPNVQISGDFQWKEDSSFVLAAKTISQGGLVQLNELQGRFTDEGLQVQGNGVVDLDVARIRSWTVADLQQLDLGGRMQSRFSVRARDGRWTSDVEGHIDNARYGVGPEPILLEPKVELAGAMTIEFARDVAFLIDGLRLSLPGLAVVAQGSMRDVSRSQELTIDGHCEYDLAVLTPRLQRMLGQGVSFTGRERKAFRVTGRLANPETGLAFASAPAPASAGQFPLLKGEMSLGWQSANLYGFVAGPAVAEGVLQESWLTTKPIQFALSGGKAALQPQVFFGTDATYLTHPGGLIADHVQVTRELCDASLQYIAPALAKSVDVAGSISLKAGKVSIPLGALEKADFSGKLVIHQVKATGGPMVRELIVLTEGQPILEIANESEVAFRVYNGRVYHENLQMRLPGILLKTSGSVGFDNTVAIVVETPIPKKWLGTPAIAKQLEGKTIKVPIGGTLDKPRLDRKALQKEIGRFARKGATDAIEQKVNEEIGKQLDKLFGPNK